MKMCESKEEGLEYQGVSAFGVLILKASNCTIKCIWTVVACFFDEMRVCHTCVCCNIGRRLKIQ